MRRRWTLLALALAGLVLTILSGWPRRWLVNLLGPPQVVLSEAYSNTSGSATFDHSTLDDLLHAFVDGDGLVDYAGLGRAGDGIDAYLRTLAEAPLDSLDRDGKLALLINAYNAFTLTLIVEHYPLESIRDIPDKDRWDAVRWNIGGSEYSLNQIEHEQIRPNFREPRIHFALVCAAIGCPPLRGEAYTGARLEAQLDDQTRRVNTDERWVGYPPGSKTIELTSLYEWYRGDFEQVAGTVLDFVSRYRDDLPESKRPRIRYLPYDWSLNVQGAKPPTAER